MNSERWRRLGVLLFVLLAALVPLADAAMKARPQLAASVAFDAAGRLWRVRLLDGLLVVDRSDDRGASFSAPQPVTRQAEAVAADGELRPDIAVAGERIYVAWTSPLPTAYAGHVRFARSLDGGRSFAAPLTINDNLDAITHRFQTLHVAADGRITLVWIDKRDGEAAKRAGKSYRGAALYYAVSDDGGASFEPNLRLAAHSCECCRIALATDGDGRPVAFWRHVFADGSRDHLLARVAPLADEPEPPRATEEHWQINACPHHGPALAVAPDGTRHGVWFAQLAGEPGLFYRGWTADGRPLAPAIRIGDASAAHPAILAVGPRLLLAWKAFDGEKTVIDVIESTDGGHRWSAPRAVAATGGASDHPQLVAFRGDAYLSWSSEAEGYRLIALAPADGGRP
ncbi:MAG: sialidase family protein [Rhodocyclaceae bacterium]|nr:sialidase family protein [Rhodocyclaceae bacterium]